MIGPAAVDLGVLDGPVLVFGGCYGNLEATRALIATARRLEIPPSRAICTGDVVAYGADPQATVDLGTRLINRFVFASTPTAEKAAEIGTVGADGVVAGYCGLPFTQLVGDGLWHDAGAIGLPANDGTPRVWFSTLRLAADGIEVIHHAPDYDHRTAAAKMRARGYPVEYAECLGSGLWPSRDVLPAVERQQRKRALAPPPVRWRVKDTVEAGTRQLERSVMDDPAGMSVA